MWPGSGGGCRARRHVGWTRRRSRHPRRSPRTTRLGRETPRGRAASDLVSRFEDLRRFGGRLRLSFLGFPAIQKRLLHAIDHMKGLISQSGSWRRQSQVTLLRMGLPWAGHAGVRAPMAVVRQDGLGHTSPKDKSWRSMSSGPGKPSGVTWRPRWRPPGLTDGPDAHKAARTQTPGREKG